MPWTIDDVEDHNKGLSEPKKRQWVAVANSVLKRCMDDGGSEEECAASAIRQANGVVSSHIEHYRLQANNYEITYQDHRGKRHMVVPVVMMTVGVHHGSHGPLLHLAEELGKYPGSWNGIPISVDHPSEDGNHVSCNAPHIIDEKMVGRIYNTMMDGDKLRAEAWVDEQQIRQVSPEAYEHLMKGMPLEVSVGVFTDDDLAAGDWNGEHYVGVARNHRPDHLALLPGGTGACSWADGCGIRANSRDEGGTADEYTGYEGGKWRCPTLSTFCGDCQWEELDPVDRNFIASHYLQGSGSSEKFDELSYPVVNPATGLVNLRAIRAIITGKHYKDCGVHIPDTVKEAAEIILADSGHDLNSNDDFAVYCPPNCGGGGGGGGIDKVAKSSGGKPLESMEQVADRVAGRIKNDEGRYGPVKSMHNTGAETSHLNVTFTNGRNSYALSHGPAFANQNHYEHSRLKSALSSHFPNAKIRMEKGPEPSAERTLISIPAGGGAAAARGPAAHTIGGVEVQTLAGRIKYDGTESSSWSGPTLADFGLGGLWEAMSASDRATVAAHFLIGAGTAETFGDLKFPVVNPRTGKLNENALRAVISGRGSQVQGVPDSERANARRMAYRLLNSEFDAELEIPKTLSYEEFGVTQKALVQEGYGVVVHALSHNEVSGQIQSKLDAMDNDSLMHYLVDCFDDYFIYQAKPRQGPMTPGGDMYKREYRVGANNEVEFVGNPQTVIKKTEYVTQEQGEKPMKSQQDGKPCCPEKVEMLIQSEMTHFQDGDREWLETLTEEQLAKLEPKEAKQPEPEPQMNKEQALQVLKGELGDKDKLMSILPAETRAIIEHGQQLYQAERSNLISAITTNSNGVLTQEYLNSKDMAELQMLAQAYPAKANFAPLGATPQVNNEDKLLPFGVDG